MGGFLCNIDEAHENTYIRHHLAMYGGKELTRINFHYKKGNDIYIKYNCTKGNLLYF